MRTGLERGQRGAGAGRRAGPALLCALAALAVAGSARGATEPREAAPRTLVLALDGMPLRVVERARAEGAFAGWPAPVPLVAPFPSVTNVSFSLMLHSRGVAPAPGYEFQHFDIDRNTVIGSSPFHYRERAYAWRDAFDSVGRGLSSKLAVYTIPWRKSRHELEAAEQALLDSAEDVVLAHVGSSDALQHLRGDAATLRFLHELDSWVTGLQRRHAERRGRPLRIVLLSDHGNSRRKIRGIEGIHRRLRRAGLHVTGHLARENDVVAPTFGLVGYGALFLEPDRAERAARALVAHPHVDLAAWLDGPRTIRVAAAGGTGVIRWRGAGSGRRYAYESSGRDPLRLKRVRSAMRAAGRLDAEGYGSDGEWFERTAEAEYPDPFHRLVGGLTGEHVVNRATVLFSVRPGYSWGLKFARAGSWLRGGRIEGTHGGLDRDSTLGFLMASDPALQPDGAVRADRALSGALPGPDHAAAAEPARAAARPRSPAAGPSAATSPLPP